MDAGGGGRAQHAGGLSCGRRGGQRGGGGGARRGLVPGARGRNRSLKRSGMVRGCAGGFQAAKVKGGPEASRMDMSF